MDDMLVTSSQATYSPSINLGDNNCAMYEVWVTSIHSGGVGAGINVTLEGSNDGLNWVPVTNPTLASPITAAPAYVPVEPTSGPVIIPWSMLRLKFTVASNNALVSASVRPFRSA